jgi:hypothetical protein
MVSVEGSRLLVWRILDKPEYNDLWQKDLKHPGSIARQLQQERRSKYEPFVRLDLYESS